MPLYEIILRTDKEIIDLVELPEMTQYERDKWRREYCKQEGLRIPAHYIYLKRIKHGFAVIPEGVKR